MIIRSLIIIGSIALMTGCGEASNDNQSNNDTGQYSVGTIRSSDINYIDINNKFNSWLITSYGGERQEIMLKVKQQLGEFNDPAEWALAIRTAPNPAGSVLASDIEVKLFSNYTQNTEICCGNTRPFSDFDVADMSYIGVSGFLNFVSNKEGYFEVEFQQETAVGSGETTGQIVTVQGCWLIASEGGASGCDI